MIKVIIADDEDKVCQLIRNLVDWRELDMEIAGIAHNGVEALDMVRELSPDLMITDIRMPGYDGIEMIRRARGLSENLSFIIISGYQHFEYAQDAIKYGVGDYLLKPIKREDLMASLNRIRQKHLRRSERISKEKMLYDQLKCGTEKLRQNLFADLLPGKAVLPDGAGPVEVNRTYRYSFRPGLYQVCAVKIDCGWEDEYDSAIRILEDKAVQIISRTLKGICFDLETSFMDSTTWCVLNYAPEQKKNLRKSMKSLLDELMLQKAAFEKFSFTLGIGEAEPEVLMLHRSFQSAKYAVEQRLVVGCDRLIEPAHPPVSTGCADGLLSDFDRKLSLFLEILDRDAVQACILQLGKKIEEEKKLSGEEIFYVASQAFDLYLTHLRGLKIAVESGGERRGDFLTRANRCGSVSQLFAYLCARVTGSLDRIAEEKRQTDTRPIRQAKQYIRQNFRSALTLEEVSGTVGFSPTYFSTLFKKETGSNFVDYLSEVRMEEAKRLLRETNLNVAAVCEQVGYSDQKHFTKSFRKFTGLKPNEYRKLYA
ncbi:response regulator [Caproicibacter fermentans]|uniref:Stage 0 sporulation protein A homolog n=1 Tax=Caproicibacter fermentans TaxID=2576756 RepID=A0A7G8T8V9_9FIRM|nr:response regulator [Caproicibacter fermentans]QNK40050.1 response regulator [Caproicibacter fermentans]